MIKYKNNIEELDIIPTINWGEDWLDKDTVVADILQQHREGGYTKFVIFYPAPGWIVTEYPPISVFEEGGKTFREIKEELKSHGISLGWWLRNSINSGTTPGMQKIIKADGNYTAVTNCPLNENVRERLAKSVAAFAKEGKPDFIFFEDDYSIAASSRMGCFCDAHLEEFSRREGKVYTREELVKCLNAGTKEAVELTRRWRELSKDSLIGMAREIRAELDKENPQIPIGHMQPGAAFYDGGDSTEEIARAFAGPKHTPFSRINSCLYVFSSSKSLPDAMFNGLYMIQNANRPLRFYHETDTYPHTRFYTSSALMRSCMGAAYSLGFDGSTFNNAQFLDYQNEERVYDKMYSQEKARFNEVHRIAKQCDIKGVQVKFDPLYNTVPGSTYALWVTVLSQFSLPLTTLEGDVAFWDKCQAEYEDDASIRKALSKGLFLDSDAARILCERGYGEFLGVDVGDYLCEGAYFKTGKADGEPISYDFSGKEVIRDTFVPDGKGYNMISPYMYAPWGYGNMRKMTVNNPGCEVITEYYNFQREFVTTAMTRFENSLGGRVVVMGITLEGNKSNSLINYRRQRLIQEHINWCGGEVVYVQGEPLVYTLMNEAKNPDESGFIGMVTLINLCEDETDSVCLHLPSKWRNLKQICTLEKNGEWRPLKCEQNGDTLLIKEPLKQLNPMYILGMI